MLAPFQPGDLTQRVTVQVRAQVADGGGGWAETWSAVDTVWARVVPVRGSERVQAQAIEGAALYRVTMFRRSDLTADHRLLWEGKILNIRWDGFAPAQDLYMTIDAEVGVAT